MIFNDLKNVWDENLPEFDVASIGAKYKAIKHKPLTDAESQTYFADQRYELMERRR
jgi:hypothetical protein